MRKKTKYPATAPSNYCFSLIYSLCKSHSPYLYILIWIWKIRIVQLFIRVAVFFWFLSLKDTNLFSNLFQSSYPLCLPSFTKLNSHINSSERKGIFQMCRQRELQSESVRPHVQLLNVCVCCMRTGRGRGGLSLLLLFIFIFIWSRLVCLHDVCRCEANGGQRPPTNLIHHQIIITLICIAALRDKEGEGEMRYPCSAVWCMQITCRNIQHTQTSVCVCLMHLKKFIFIDTGMCFSFKMISVLFHMDGFTIKSLFISC